MDPLALYQSDDLSWLGRPDREVEGTFVERKAWCTAEDLAKQISGFANGQPPGGLIVIGVTSKGEIIGVDDRRAALEETLGKLASVVDAADWQYRWLPSLKTVLFVYVPFSANRVICLSSGKAYRRQGERTLELLPDQLVELRYAKGERRFELEPAAPFASDLLDSQQATAFLDGVTQRNGLTLPTTIREALVHKGLIGKENGALNFAGLVALGKAPSELLPGARLRFLKFEGTTEASGTQRNVVKDTWFDGPVPTIVADFRTFMKSTIREFDYLGQDGRFVHEPEYPAFALDEAVVNALVHRSYSLKNAAVFVRMFEDRIEVESPGGFPSNARPDSEGVFPFSAPRNPQLAQALHYLEIVRLAREGTRRMHDEMAGLGLPPPQFKEVQSATVVVTLYNDIERRRARLGADEANEQWNEVLRHLGSDLAIERRQAISTWEGLARRNAFAPEQAWRLAIAQARSGRVSNSDKARILNLLAVQPADALSSIARSLYEGMVSGQFEPETEVSNQVATILARIDDVVEQVVEWIETLGPISGTEGGALATAFLVLRYRLHRDRLPPRQWLDRIVALSEKYKDIPVASALYGDITGHPPSK